MKLSLTKDELVAALKEVYPPIHGYTIESIDINEYRSGTDFCSITLEKSTESPPAEQPAAPCLEPGT